MKKILLLLVSLILLCGCSEYIPPYKITEMQYAAEFQKEFGKVPYGHSWDYYSVYSHIDSIQTRASYEYYIEDCEQTYDISHNDIWTQYLPEKKDNSNIGVSNFKLISNGEFYCNCVWYYSTNPTIPNRKFECGILYDNEEIPLFGSYEYDVKKNGGVNPMFAKLINLGYGNPFKFYIKYTNNGVNKLISDEYAKLLYSDIVCDQQIIIIAFEDTPLNKSNCDKDFNDIVLYIVGNPNLPILETKRFMCEDLSASQGSDFDYNDIVFDIHPLENSTEVSIQALGGTLPIKLFVGGYCIGNDDLHKVLKTNYVQSNVGTTLNIPIYKEEIPLIIDDLNSFDQVSVKVGTNFETIILYKEYTSSPALIAVPYKTKWMREYTNIKYGYPNFFKDNWYDYCVDKYVIDKQ